MAVIVPSTVLHNVTFERAEKRILDEAQQIKKSKLDFMTRQILDPVADQLIEFCRESVEFSNAVVEDEQKSLAECLKAALVDIKKDCSDDAVYTRAAQYYLPRCAVRHTRKLVLNSDEDIKKGSSMVSLFDFM